MKIILFMKENGLMGAKMEEVYIYKKTESDTMVIGKMANIMVMADA